MISKKPWIACCENFQTETARSSDAAAHLKNNSIEEIDGVGLLYYVALHYEPKSIYISPSVQRAIFMEQSMRFWLGFSWWAV